MVSGVKVSNRQIQELQKICTLLYKLQAEMVESEAIQTAVTQAGIQAATVAQMELREADAGPTSGTSMAKVGEVHRHRNGRPALRELAFNWKAPDTCVEILSFEMEVHIYF